MEEQPGKQGKGLGGTQGTRVFLRSELPSQTEPTSEVGGGRLPRLLGTSAPLVGRAFMLRRGKTLVGRKETNDIVIPESSVSAMHAWVINDGGQCRVMNMLSTNGTFVNGAKVHEANLKPGDRVRFGNVELLFEGADAPAASAGLFARGARRLLAVALLVMLALTAWWLLAR